jgi:hypothetical protein
MEVISGLVAHALTMALLVTMSRLAAVGGVAFAYTGYLNLALGDAVSQVEKRTGTVGHGFTVQKAIQ